MYTVSISDTNTPTLSPTLPNYMENVALHVIDIDNFRVCVSMLVRTSVKHM